MPKLNYALGVVGLSILGAVLYGIVHDMATAHIAVEYFTKWHPKVVDSESPIVLALVWGFIATWWMGLIFGLALAGCATYGSQPLLPLQRIWRAIVIGLAAVLFLAFLVMACAFVVVQTLHVDSVGNPPELLAVAAAHQASYICSAGLGIILCIWVVRTRIAIDPTMPDWVDP